MTPTTTAKRLTRWALLHGTVRVAVGRARRAGDLQAQFMTEPRYRDDPFPFYEQVRARGPLVPGRFAHVTADHAVCSALLTSPDFRAGPDEDALPAPVRRAITWSRDPLALGPIDPPSMLAVEPPDHTRYRRTVSKVFTARAVEQLRARAQTIADDLLDHLQDLPRFDLVSAYCTQLPVAVICSVLGVRPQDHDTVLDFGHKGAPGLDVGLAYRDYRAVDDAARGFQVWLGEHLARLAREPGEDLLSQLVHAEDDGVRLTPAELKATAGLVLAAGFETTVNLLASGTVLLLQHPDRLAALHADPSSWPAAVDETLRLEGPVQLTGRFALRDTELAGQQLRGGSLVLAYLGGANRDPRVFDDPARFDLTRSNVRDHLSFSAGRHFCLGAALARLEGEVGLRTLFERFPDLALDGPGRRSRTRVLRGWESLPVRTREPEPV